jgi:tetratricopeptide (TPR) repeat protein
MLAFVLIAVATSVFAAQAELDRRVRAAVAKLDQGDALGAMLDFESILGRDEEYWPAHYHLGRAQVQLGDDLGARRSFQRAAELNPGNPDLHFLIASAAWQLADFETAWAQGIAAWQAGYDPVSVQGMFDQLAQYAPAPTDLEQRLAAPRVVVEAPEDEGDPGLEAIADDLRAELFRAPVVALVRDPAIARFTVRVERTDDARVRLGFVDGEANELGSRTLAMSGPEPDATAMLALEAFVASVLGWVGE